MSPLILLKHLSKIYRQGIRKTVAIDDLSLSIKESETLGLVGESGCGKSTIGKCLLALEDPSSGSIEYKGKSLADFSKQELFEFRKEVQVIFQDPYSSLNPRMTAGEIIAEPLYIHKMIPASEIPAYLEDLALKVGLSPYLLKRFPHEFSGGQRQRIGIARALALRPKFIVCDEPISALDVPIQAQIINLLKDLQREMGLTFLFITHNLSVVRYISDRIAVLYQGHLVELSSSEDLYKNPLHPYTQVLLSSIPKIDFSPKESPPLAMATDPTKTSAGCPFAPRCPYAFAPCWTERPALHSHLPEHQVACHLYPSKAVLRAPSSDSQARKDTQEGAE